MQRPSPIIDWVPENRTPADISTWRDVVNVLVHHGHVRLVWYGDAWTLVSALRYVDNGESRDVRDELRVALRAAGLSVS